VRIACSSCSFSSFNSARILATSIMVPSRPAGRCRIKPRSKT
jgi:hypothetical protein